MPKGNAAVVWVVERENTGMAAAAAVLKENLRGTCTRLCFLTTAGLKQYGCRRGGHHRSL